MTYTHAAHEDLDGTWTIRPVDPDSDEQGAVVATYANLHDAEGDGWVIDGWRGESLVEGKGDLGCYAYRRYTLWELVGRREIAERLAIAVGTVDSWRLRHADFPAPVLQLAMGPIWSWPEVARWHDVERRPGRPPSDLSLLFGD